MDRANLLAQAVLGPENTPANFDIVEEFVDAEEIVEPVENFDIAGALENYDRLSNYLLMRLVGRGAYGEVWLANDLRKNELVALKRLKLSDLREGVSKQTMLTNVVVWQFPNLALREISILMHLGHHPNIVKLHSVVFSLPHQGGEDVAVDENAFPPLLTGENLETLRADVLRHFPNHPTKVRKIGPETYALVRSSDSSDTPIIEEDIDEFLVSSSGSIWMVFEFTPFDLHTYIEVNEHEGKMLTIPEVKFVIKELLAALELCHSQNVLHRDLKTANLLIDYSGHIKLADFGLARSYCSMSGFVYPDNIYAEADDSLFDVHLTNRVVTLWYRPPEILLGSKEYTTAADIWSVGCILYEMMCGKALFRAENELGVLRAIVSKLGPPSEATWPEYSTMPLRHSASANPMVKEPGLIMSKDNNAKSKIVNLVGESAWDFVASMLKYNPAQRLTASEALAHPWLQRGVAECLPIDPEKATVGNSVTLKREKERIRASALKSRRPQNRSRYLNVDEQLEKIRASRLHQGKCLTEQLETTLKEKEAELNKWMASINQQTSNNGAAGSRPFGSDSHSDSDLGLEEGEIASPTLEASSRRR